MSGKTAYAIISYKRGTNTPYQVHRVLVLHPGKNSSTCLVIRAGTIMRISNKRIWNEYETCKKHLIEFIGKQIDELVNDIEMIKASTEADCM